MLDSLQDLNRKTAVAAKYAQISAINSEVSLHLQAKELAYQKSNFWLK
jgi:hypothetical protein